MLLSQLAQGQLSLLQQPHRQQQRHRGQGQRGGQGIAHQPRHRRAAHEAVAQVAGGGFAQGGEDLLDVVRGLGVHGRRVGLGVLGQRVAQAVAQFDFPVNGWSRTPKALPGVQCFAGAEQLDAFLQASRVLVCLLPLTSETQDILNRRTLSLLQPGGYVINVARGAHLVDDDLIALINSGHLAGATLDVFRTEPLPPKHAFWQHSKITLTPHTSARTLREESAAQIANKIKALANGQTISGRVDPSTGY